MPVIHTERYELEPTPIGRGGFGEIFLAKDLLFDRAVVIKTILASQLYGIDQPTVRRQFFREAVISAKLGLQCPFIVKVFDYGYDRESDLPFFVMEFVQGYDLGKHIGMFGWERAVVLLDHMLQALLAAHSRDVVHSDISPDNIIFDEVNGVYKLNDFGLAKLLTSTLMRRGSLLSLTGGKPGFLPLHDWQSGDRSAHSDLYGLTVTIINLLTGNMPLWQRRDVGYVAPRAEDFLATTTPEFTHTVTLPLYTKARPVFSVPVMKQKRKGEELSHYGVAISKDNLIAFFDDVLAGRILTVKAAVETLQEVVRQNLAVAG